MNPFFRNILKVNPSTLNKVPERFLEDADIEVAIKKGYEITEETPTHLLKFSKMRNLFFEKYQTEIENGTKKLTFKELSYLLDDPEYIDKLFKDTIMDLNNYSESEKATLVSKIANNISSVNYESAQSLIHNNIELVYAYFELNVNKVSMLENIDVDYERIYEIIQRNISEFRKYNITKKLFEVWYKHDKNILLDSNLSSAIFNDDKIISLIEESDFSVEELGATHVLGKPKILLHYLKKDFSNIRHVQSLYTDNFKEILDLLLKDIKENIKYIPKLSELAPGHQVNDEYKEKIINAIVQNNLTLEDCNWQFLKNSPLVSYTSIMNKPSLLIELTNFTFYGFDQLTEEQKQDIVKLIEDKKVIFSEVNQVLSNNYPLLLAAVKQNPYIVDNVLPNCYVNVAVKDLIDSGYTLSVNSPSFFFNYAPDFVLEALKKDISIIDHREFYYKYNNDADILTMYNILKSHNYKLAPDSPKHLFNNALLVLEGLKENRITLDDINYFNYDFDSKYKNELYSYILDNYDLEEIKNSSQGYYILNSKLGIYSYHSQTPEFLTDKIYTELRNDFSKCLNYQENTVSNSNIQKLIYELYLSDYENNSKYYDESKLLQSNCYIALHECLENDKPIPKTTILNSECIATFRSKYKEKNITFKESYLRLISKDEYLEVFKSFPEIIDDINDKTLEYSFYLQDFVPGIIECIEQNIYKLNPKTPIDLITYLLDYCIANNVENIEYLLKPTEGYYTKYFSRNIVTKTLELMKNASFDFRKVHSDIFGSITLDEFYQIALVNPKILEFSNRKSSEGTYFYKYEPIAKLPIPKKFNIKDEHTPEEIKVFLLEHPQYLTREQVTSKLQVNDEEWLELHNALLKYLDGNFTSIYNGGDFKYLLFKDSNTIDESIIDQMIEQNPGILLAHFKENLREDYYLRIIERLKQVPKENLHVELDVLSDKATYKKVLRDLYPIEDLIAYSLFSDEEIYEMWQQVDQSVKDNPPNRVFSIRAIVSELAARDITLLKRANFNNRFYNKNPEYTSFIYEIFEANKDKINIFEYNIFFNNPLVRAKYSQDFEYTKANYILNEVTWNDFYYLSEDQQEIFQNISLANDPNTILYLDYNVMANYIKTKRLTAVTPEIYKGLVGTGNFINLLENYFDECKKYFKTGDFKDSKMELIDDIFISNKYVLTKDSPEELKRSKAIAINSMKLNRLSIIHANASLEFDEHEQQTILDILLSNKIYYNENTFDFLHTHYDYIYQSVLNNPESINHIITTNLTLLELTDLIKLTKEHINNNKYEIKMNIPYWLLFDEDIRRIYIEKYPDKASTLDDFKYQYDKGITNQNNPYFIIKEAIDNYTNIDNMTFDSNRIYPKELVDELVDKLISTNYVLSPKTPKFLLDNNNFIYYALKNNYSIPQKYIEDFITFENMYQLQDKDLFKKYIDAGYGKKYEPYYLKFGVEETILGAMKYGYILSKESIVTINSISELQEIINNKIKSGYIYSNLLDYIIRSEYELTKTEIINGLGDDRNYSYRTQVSNNDKLFKYLLKKDPNLICLYTGNTNGIYKLAIENGFILTKEIYEQHPALRNSIYMSKLALDIDHNNLYLYTGTDETFFKYAVDTKKIIPNIEQLSNCPNLKNSPIIIRRGMQEDISFAYLYTGDPDLLQDLFDIKDKKGNTVPLTKDSISKLEFMHDSVYLISRAIITDSNNVELYTGFSEEVFELAIKNGYIPSKEVLESKDNIKRSIAIIQKAIYENIDNVLYYTGEASNIENIFDIQDKNGNKFIATPEKIKDFYIIHNNDSLMSKAILQDPNNIVYYTGKNEDIYKLALDNGYKPKIEDFNISLQLKNSITIHTYIIEKDNSLSPLLVYYSGEDDELIIKIYKLLLKEKYPEIIKNDSDIKNYVSIWKSFNDFTTHKRLLAYMNPKNVQAFESMKIDYYLVLKYGIKNDKMQEYITILDNDNSEEFTSLYNKITQEDIEFNNNAFGVDIFLKIARLYNRYPKLSKEIINSQLTSDQVANLQKLINSNQVISNIESIKDLELYEEKLKDEINMVLNKDNVTPLELKDTILRYVFDLNMKEFKHILENYINFDTLDKIIAKCTSDDAELFAEATMLRAMLSMVEETINATEDINSLKKLLQEYANNSMLVDKTRSLFYDLKERIRNIYELDAIVSLTDFKDKSLPTRESTHHLKKQIIELKNSEYVIYAHAVSGTNYEEYVNHRFNGKVTICVSPISNLGKKLYSDSGVVLGFTEIPRGGFIGSSNRNMSSNDYINSNDYEVHDDHYYHLEIKDSSSLTPSRHPETLLYRDGLIPSCIIIRGEEPTVAEIEAQERISAAIREKFGYDDSFEIPLVHTQAIGSVADLKKKDDIIVLEGEKAPTEKRYIDADVELGEYQTKIDKIQEIREQALKLREVVEQLGIEKSPVYDIIKMKIGGSHDMFKCHLKDREGVYYLKPGYRKDGLQIDPYRSYAMQASYDIQKIANPDHAVFVDTITVPLSALDKNATGEVLCSVIEVMPDTTSYEGWKTAAQYQELSEQEMDSFVCEFISDYLLFSYDTKAENFLKDKNGQAYGIDKEQALKFILEPLFIKRDQDGIIESYNTDMKSSLSFDPNGCGIIYKRIFEQVEAGNQKISEATFNKAQAALDRIESITDEDYKKIFENYVNEFSISSVTKNIRDKYEQNGATKEEAIEFVKEELYLSLLARKNNLRLEFNKYFKDIITKYYNSKGEEVPEWITAIKEKSI